MIGFNARVLNGLPVFVEVETSMDRDYGLIVDEMAIFWMMPNVLGERKRAMVIENKMTSNDWDELESDFIEYHC